MKTKVFRSILSLALCLLLLCNAVAAFAEEVKIPVIESAGAFTIPDTEGLRFTRKMGVGWNLGNTFDAYSDRKVSDHMSIEKSWVGVYTTEDMIEMVHAAGFQSIRIPVSWHNHVDADFRIDEAWLDRVQQVADWAMNRGMYVILNTHHDVSPDFYYPDEAHEEHSRQYLSAVWEQLALRFRDYDEHLILEGMNEPRLKDTEFEWWLDRESEACLESAEVINRLNQLFVDTVRATGGANATRYLMVPGYDASPDFTDDTLYRLPEDTAEDRLIVSVHAYTPYSFALQQDGGTPSFDAENAMDRSKVADFMNVLYHRFIENGIPVVIGEYGALDKNNLQDRVDFHAWYVASASARNMPCLLWDNGNFSGWGEGFGFLNRAKGEWGFPEIIEAIMTYRMTD